MVGGQRAGFAIQDGMGSQHELVELAMEAVVERKLLQMWLQAAER